MKTDSEALWSVARWLAPALAALAILAGAIVLTVVMVVRPWASNRAAGETHFNYDIEADYARSGVAYLGEESGAPEGWVRAASAAALPDQGLVAYVAYGCASCHGVDGLGTAAGPPIAGGEVRRVVNITRKGPGSMPVYDEANLSENWLDLIAEYVANLAPAPRSPTAVPAPKPTAYPTATPTPGPTATPEPTPLPAGAPTATPTPSPTPTPTPDPVRLEDARRVYVEVGCDVCHGALGEGAAEGPGLMGLTASELRDLTRAEVRDPDPEWPKPMDAYTIDDVSEAELDEIIFYLLNLPE